MPESVLYSVIGFLGLAVITLSGLWVRAHDNHRQWAVKKITEHETKVAILEKTYLDIKDDVRDIKDTLRQHLEIETRFQQAVLSKFNIDLNK